MSDPDMEYVTRRELREELTPIHTMLRHLLETMERGFRQVNARIDQSDARIAQADASVVNLRRDLTALIEHSSAELRRDLTSEIRASAEETRTWIGALDDKYRDLPARVTALENGRSAPPTRASRRRAAKSR